MGAFGLQILSHELKHDESGTTYAMYAIRVTDEVSGHTWVVQRRFRDIRRLHKVLLNAYHGVPKCPSRKLFGHSKERFLRKRKKELEFFLMMVIDLPFVYCHPAAKEFFEFEHMKALPAADGSDTEDGSHSLHVTFGPATALSPANREPRVSSIYSVNAESTGAYKDLKEGFLCGLKPIAMFCSAL